MDGRLRSSRGAGVTDGCFAKAGEAVSVGSWPEKLYEALDVPEMPQIGCEGASKPSADARWATVHVLEGSAAGSAGRPVGEDTAAGPSSARAWSCCPAQSEGALPR